MKKEIMELIGSLFGIIVVIILITTKSFIAFFSSLIILVILHQCINLIISKKISLSDIGQIDKMNGRKFEEYLSILFKKMGNKVRLTKKTGDFGADLVLKDRNGKKIVVQAKRYKGNVGIKAVQEIASAKAHYNASESWVVTNSYYTKSAIELAKSNNVKLFNRSDLKGWIKKLKKKR